MCDVQSNERPLLPELILTANAYNLEGRILEYPELKHLWLDMRLGKALGFRVASALLGLLLTGSIGQGTASQPMLA